MTFDEVDFETATWTIEASWMKMAKPHQVPLSPQALSILKDQLAKGGPKQKYVFTTHGMRSSFRSWAADTGLAFEVAEACFGAMPQATCWCKPISAARCWSGAGR